MNNFFKKNNLMILLAVVGIIILLGFSLYQWKKHKIKPVLPTNAPSIKISPQEFIDHTSNSPEEGGIKIYGSPTPTHSVEKKFLQK